MRAAASSILLIASVTLIAISARAEGDCEGVDFNANGIVDETDIELFRILIGKAAGEDGFLAAADLDGSGMITPIDFQLMLSCR